LERNFWLARCLIEPTVGFITQLLRKRASALFFYA
jgi:hypothetical protein